MLAKKLSELPPVQRLSAARAKAREKMPYFGAGILSLVPRECPGLGTLGVTSSSILLVDYEVLGAWTASEAAFAILHEYLHIYFRHADRFAALLRSGTARRSDARMWNIAADCEINDNLVAAGLPLPSIGGGKPHLPSDHGFDDDCLAEVYFVAFKKRKGNCPADSQDPGWGRCGSGAGYALPGEPSADDPDGRTKIEQEIQRKVDSENIITASKTRGDVPGGLSRHAGADLQEPQISWQQKFRHRLGRSVTRKAGDVDYTPMNRARMQSALEWAYGFESPVLLGMDAPVVVVVLVIDDSGSMGDAQIQHIISEAQGIIRSQGGARLSVIVCDAQVHSVGQVKTAAEIGAKMLNGGGGTDFRPAFEAIAKLKPEPDVIVFGTDGYGWYPDSPPKQDVIWLNMNGCIGVDWGEVINLSTECRE